MRRCSLLLAGLVGCAGVSHEADDAAAANAESESVSDTVTLLMPDYPASKAGRLTARSEALEEEHRFVGSWAAEAGRCREPTVVQVIARGDSLGTVVFIGPSTDGDIVGEYRVVEGRRGVPDTSTARVAVQAYGDRTRPEGYRAVGGVVEIHRADSIIEGNLAVELYDDLLGATILLAASFEAPLRNATAEWCSVFGPKPEPVPVRSGRR